MKLYGWLKAITTLLAVMVLSIAILSVGTSCKGIAAMAGLGSLPKEAGIYIDVGNGWQTIPPDKLNWKQPSAYPCYEDIDISDEDLSKVALTIRRGCKVIKMGWRMTPSETTTIQQAIFFDQTLLRGQLALLKQERGTILPEEGHYSQSEGRWVEPTGGAIDGWVKDYAADWIKPTESPNSRPTEGVQLVEFTLPAASTVFLLSSWMVGEVYLRF